MRENMGLYRGKRKDNGEWIEGYLVKKQDPLLGIVDCFILTQEFDHCCITGEPTVLKSQMTWFKVDPETIGEYSGLPDKNGKRIFEGDCINHPLNVVEFLSGGFYVAGDRPLDFMARYGEIVCNIHDNLKRLEVSGDE